MVCNDIVQEGAQKLNGKLSPSEIDEICESLILDYLRKANQTDIECVDIEGFLIDYLGYNLIYETIAEDDPNKVAFTADGVTPLKIQKGRDVVSCVYPANTVVIDKYFLRLDLSGVRRFTIGHECGHIVKERMYETKCCASFYRDKQFVNTIPNSEFQLYFKMEENQCDNFSAGFLMPKFLTLKKIDFFNGGRKLPLYGSFVLKSEEKHTIKKMADSLGVSYSALFYRLKHFNLFEPHYMSEFCGELGFGGDS